MSYILNALRKAENKGFAADNQKIKKQILVLKQRNRVGKLRILILVIALLGALLFGWLLGQKQQPQTEHILIDSVDTFPGTDHTSLVRGMNKPDVDSTKLNVESQTYVESRSGHALPAQSINEISDKLKEEIADVNPPIPVRAVTLSQEKSQIKQEAQPQVELQTTPQALTLGDKKEPLPNYSELPLLIKQKLQPLKLSLHFYNSSPERRLVRINGKILHEDDRIDHALAVEEITPRSTILNFDGYLFELDAPGG